MLLQFYKRNDIKFYAAFISLLLSVIAYYKHEPINYDGILYIAAAAAYLKTGIMGAMQLYNWPFYAIVIAWISKITTLSLLSVAYLLNAAFLSLIIVAFITLLAELGAARRLQIIGALLILIYPQLNDYRDYVVRDFGYWLFFLLAFWQLLRFIKTQHIGNAINWNLTIILATLFRIEGLILFLLAPLVIAFLTEQPRSRRCLMLLQVYGFLGLAVIVGAAYSIGHPAFITHLGRIPEALQQIGYGWQAVCAHFHDKLNLVRTTLLNPFAAMHALTFMLCGLTGVFLALVVTTLSPLYTLLAGYALSSAALKLDKTTRYALYYWLALNALIPAAFFAQQLFLSSRYLMALNLMLLLWVSAALERLYVDWQLAFKARAKQQWLLPLIGLVLIGMAAGAVIRYGYSKAYITAAGEWIEQHTPPNSSVYSNNRQVLFYANRTPIKFTSSTYLLYDDSQPLRTVQPHAWENYDYLALRITHQARVDEAKILQMIGYKPLQVFQNKRGDKVLLFKISKRPDTSDQLN